jgi:periplasmic protein TonB
VKPELPEELLKSATKTFVRVAFEIEADGSFSVELRTSSGSDEVDNRVKAALERWKWKPATRAGQPVASRELLKVELSE